MRKLFLLVALLFPVAAFCQGVRYDNIAVTNFFGTLRSVPNATIRVCASGATGVPCSPLASIFSNLALSNALTNPFNADANGNFFFYAAQSTYVIQVSGTGITTYTLNDVSLGGISILGLNNTFSGTNIFNGAANLNGGGALVGTFTGNHTLTGSVTFNGGATFGSGLTVPSLIDTGLISGNCVQASTGGLLTTISFACGTVLTTGSPISGNLAKFSGALSLTNTDLTGDISTSGGSVTILASIISGAKTWSNLATFSAGITGTGNIGTLTAPYANLTSFPAACGANFFATQISSTPGCTQPAFSNLSGTISSAQFGSQSANTFLGAPNGSSGNPTFRAVNISTADVTGNLPVGNISPGSNGQCINTAGGVSAWGSCAGTAGVQLIGTSNTTTVTVNASTTGFQTLQTACATTPCYAANVLNTVGKTWDMETTGTASFVNTTETVQFAVNNAGVMNSFAPSSIGNAVWWLKMTCTTTVTGASGQALCMYTESMQDGAAKMFVGSNTVILSINFTLTYSPTFLVSFTTASTSNVCSSAYAITHQHN